MIVGIDPSLSSTGIATASDHYVVRTEAGQPGRLMLIHTAVARAVNGCTLAVLEDLPTHAKSAGLTGQAQGVIRLALQQHDVPYVLVPPATLKKYATGNGNATKADMRMAWYQRAGEDVRQEDEVDALWLRQVGLTLTDHPHAITMPKLNRAVLEKVVMP